LDFEVLGERSILIDCDVLDADGGTRTASITGAYVAMGLALKKLAKEFPSLNRALKTAVAAVSVGMVSGEAVLDLNYVEDKDAGVDMNIVMTSANQFIEVQGTAEAVPFNREQMNALLDVATVGLTQLFEIQKQTLAI
jgi:ribonuclease PH